MTGRIEYYGRCKPLRVCDISGAVRFCVLSRLHGLDSRHYCQGPCTAIIGVATSIAIAVVVYIDTAIAIVFVRYRCCCCCYRYRGGSLPRAHERSGDVGRPLESPNPRCIRTKRNPAGS